MTITTSKGDWLWVPIPQAVNLEGNGYNKIYTGDGEYEFHSLPYSELPPIKTGIKTSEATFHCTTNGITEEQAGEILGIEESESMDRNIYELDKLMKAHNLTGNYVILRVNKQ